eukprot:gene408-266_t
MREPRFVVRWNKEIRASQLTATESDEEDDEEEEDNENEGDEEAPANETDGNGRANRASQKKSTSQALVDPQDIQVQLGGDKGHKSEEDDEFEDKDDARPKRAGRCGSVCRRGGCFYSCGPTYYRQLYCRWQSYPVILLLPGAYLVFQWVLVYLDVFSTWADPVLATNDVYSFMAYGGLLLAHLGIYLFLCIGVLTWGKLRLVQFYAPAQQPPGHLSGRAVSRNLRPASTAQSTPI